MNSPFRSARAAFTLIELLTVIAIIGILAAIIIPTVSTVRATARETQGRSNLRQIGLSLQLYANDNKQRLPIAYDSATNTSWFVTTRPYLPVSKAGAGARENAVFADTNAVTSYGATSTDEISNSYTPGGGFLAQGQRPGVWDDSGTARPLNTIANPSRALWLMDGAKSNSTAPYFAYVSCSHNAWLNAAAGNADRPDFRQRNKINVLFGDNSVRSLGRSDAAVLYPDTRSWRAL